MQYAILLKVVIFVVVILLTSPPAADAVCCYATDFLFCDDCKKSTPYCGIGSCNLFGCDCEGGCRRGACSPATKRSFETTEVSNAGLVISFGDTNKDGRLSIEEAKILLQNDPGINVETVPELDTDNDGFLTVEELDDLMKS